MTEFCSDPNYLGVKFMELSGAMTSWTPHGKRLIALSMCEKGKSFIGAALLLRKQGGYEYVVLHLLCQGIEVLGEGLPFARELR